MQVNALRRLKSKLSSGPVFGPFSKSTDPAFVEAAGYAGFDFIILDLEHGPSSTQNLQHLIRAAELCGLVPIVRVKPNWLNLIGEVLDLGALGVQIPQITDAEDARLVVSAARFGPDGERGVCRFVRAARYSTTERTLYFEQSNQALVVLQLEGSKALRNVDSILSATEIDVVFIGPYDLSQSLGRPGEVNHPEVIEAMAALVQACHNREVTVGTFVDTPSEAERWLKLGVRYLAYSVDVGIFAQACSSLVESLRAMSVTGEPSYSGKSE